jgi:hypothetical protein
MKTYIVKIDEYGNKRWYLNGNLHRTDGPAVEYADGSKFWYLNGNLHRTDGPAMEYADGSKEWYLNDKDYTEADWRKQLNKLNKATCVGKIVEVDGVKYKLVQT